MRDSDNDSLEPPACHTKCVYAAKHGSSRTDLAPWTRRVFLGMLARLGRMWPPT